MSVEADGYAVVTGILDAAERDRAARALDAVFAAEADVAEERGWATAAHRVAYALPVKDPAFVGLCTHPRLVAAARAVLGPDCVVAGCNGLDLPPGGVGQDLHRDHPVPTPGTVLYLHAVCALDPFTAANGATRVVPGSQAGGDPAAGAAAAVAVEVPAGGAVLLDGAVVHAAGPNTTTGRRRALHVLFARPWVQPHWDLPGTFTPEEASALTEEQRQLLGFASRPRRWDRGARRVVR